MLVDSRHCVEAIWERWAAERGMDARAIVSVAHGRRTSETLRQIAPHLDIAKEVAALDRMEESETRGVVPVPGAANLLAALRIGQWAIVTSGSLHVARLRVRVGGLPVPPVLITAEDVKEGKPSPQGYLRAASLLGIPPADCLVFEDAPAGIAAAVAGGMRVIGIASTHTPEALSSATHCVGALSDVSVRQDGSGSLIITG